jgi:NADP-dependent 3-hydroxy acid dehydrogenase YdfG
MQSLEGKVAWITGAGTGIGEAGALALAEEGMVVALTGRRPEPLRKVAEAVRGAGAEAMVLPLDVGDKDAVRSAFAAIDDAHGRVDVLINNAGINIAQRRFHQLTPESWDKVVQIDLNGAFYCIHAVLPGMRARKDGLVINVSSWAGKHTSYVSGTVYNAAKHAMVAMSANLNMEEGRNGIRSCTICPAEVATPILDGRPVPVGPEERARMLQPEDLGETIRFVARMPARACVNEILISPAWNRSHLGYPDFRPPWPPE